MQAAVFVQLRGDFLVTFKTVERRCSRGDFMAFCAVGTSTQALMCSRKRSRRYLRARRMNTCQQHKDQGAGCEHPITHTQMVLRWDPVVPATNARFAHSSFPAIPWSETASGELKVTVRTFDERHSTMS